MYFKGYLLGFFAIFLSIIQCQAAIVSSQTMFSPHGDEIPLIPFLDYYIDESMLWDIDEAASLNHASAYKPFAMDKLPLTEGTIWLRFILSPAAQGSKPATYLLDMGPSTPGIPVLYDPQRNELSGAMEWRENTPGQRDILLLPDQGPESLVCYIRLDGLPGPWFAPTIRSPQNAASNWGSLSRIGAILALTVVMLLCLLRGLGENGQWRYWIALFVCLSLAQALLGMPKIQETFSLINLLTILAPGLALMMLPHAGRHLMNTKEYSRSVDLQLILLSLPGAALALLPLVPNWDWLDRWLDLWPVGTILFIPTAIGAWLMGLAGARRFLLACLFPPIFVAFAIFGLEFGFPANLLASAPLWGIAFSALLLAASKSPGNTITAVKKSNQKIISPVMDSTEPIINLNHPLDDPNLRIISVPEKTIEENEPVSNPSQFPSNDPLERKELALREPLEDVLRETSALSSCSLPPAARQSTEKIMLAGQRMANIISRSDLIVEHQNYQTSEENFNLQRILRNAHDNVAPIAEHAGLSLSWYIPPHLDQQFRGDAVTLEEVLTLLLENAIRGTKHGAIHLSGKRVPDSSDPGHILFTVTDSGAGVPPHQRSSLAVIKAWELSGRYNGYLGMDANPRGLTISFSMHFLPAIDEADTPKNIPHIIVVSDSTDQLENMANILSSMPARVTEAASLNEVLIRQRMDASPLLITCGKFALPSAGDTVREFAALARIAGFAGCHILAITPDDSQWTLLKPSGFTHAMIEPVDAEILLETARDLIETSGSQSDNNSSNKNNSTLIELVDAFYSHTAQFEEMPIEETDNFNTPLSTPGNDNNNFEGPDWLNTLNQNNSSDNQDEAPKNQTELAETGNVPNQDQITEDKISADKKDENSNDQNLSSLKKEVPLPPIVEAKSQTSSSSPAQQRKQESSSIDFIMDTTADNEIHSEQQQDLTNDSPTEKDDNFANNSRPGQDPIIIALVERLEEAMNQANAAFRQQDTSEVAEAIGRLARQAENFGGLRQLTRMAQTVERAARANDLAAVKDLLPELANAVERNRIALTQ